MTFAVVELGEALAGMAQFVGLTNLVSEDFVGLRRSALDYSGWWSFDTTEAIARYVPLALSVDPFLDRCMSLDKLIIEGLSEGSLRLSLEAAGAPKSAIAKLRTLKLLDCLVRLTQLANTAALSISEDGTVLWRRLAEESTVPVQPIAHLFALRDVRLLKAHKASDREKRLQAGLERFGIASGETAAGFGKILDQIYDLLIDELREAAAKITAAL